MCWDRVHIMTRLLVLTGRQIERSKGSAGTSSGALDVREYEVGEEGTSPPSSTMGKGTVLVTAGRWLVATVTTRNMKQSLSLHFLIFHRQVWYLPVLRSISHRAAAWG